MKGILFLTIIITTLSSCSEPFPYQYQNEEQIIKCSKNDSKLTHEALYSFKSDISKYYLKESQDKEYLNFTYSYNHYIYRGAMGDVNFKEITSPHTLLIVNELKKDKGLFVKVNGKNTLNYQSDVVKCLINNIKTEEIKNKIINLIEVDYLSPEIMAENYRKTSMDTHIDPNYLMFVALDTYYLRLIDLKIPENN